MDSLSYLPDVINYVNQTDFSSLPGWQPEGAPTITPLAQGEYNMNYLLKQGEQTWVLRVNIGSQIQREDQIRYEFDALRMLKDCRKTPEPYYLDDSKTFLNHGVLVMQYLPGETLDYPRDLQQAARLFARIHTFSHLLPDSGHLIVEHEPLSMIYEECSRLLKVYFESPQADPDVQDFLQEVLDWAEEARHQETCFIQAPWHCVINTEVNSSNFILDRDKDRIYLVDWEKPLWGDPSQDLSHFSVPTTTLWKTNYRMSSEDRKVFLETYKQEVDDEYLAGKIEERVRLRDPFNCLRGVSWCAMAWVNYQNGSHALQNPDTAARLSMYINPDFLHSLFDGVINNIS